MRIKDLESCGALPDDQGADRADDSARARGLRHGRSDADPSAFPLSVTAPATSATVVRAGAAQVGRPSRGRLQ